MRIRDIESGGHYWTRVSGERVKVRVIERFQVTAFGGKRRRVWKLRVVRLDTGRELPGLRSPQALHPTDGRQGEWPSMTEKQDAPRQSNGVPRYEPSPGTFTAKVMEGWQDEPASMRDTLDTLASMSINSPPRESLPYVPRVRDASPWGPIQLVTEIAPGIHFCSTAGHGGMLLDRRRTAMLRQRYPKARTDRMLGAGIPASGGVNVVGTWWEEDCAVCYVVTAFPEAFPGKSDEAAEMLAAVEKSIAARS